jgi:sugar/nucleoside kinase (ribokinase family)
MAKILACGFVNFDIIAAGLPGLPEPGGVVHAPNGVRFWLGGHTANVSVDLVQLGAREGSVAIAAAVGKDMAGRFIEDFLVSKKVACFIQEVDGVETGKSIVLVQSGKDRSFILNGGANSRLDYGHVLEALDEVSPKILYLACGILGDFDLRIEELFRLCRSRGIVTILDAVQPEGKDWDFSHAALPYTDVMHSNRLELAEITGTSDTEQGLAFLSEKGVALAVLSDGPGGIVAHLRHRFIRQPGFRVEAIDPTGAGDAFCAGMAMKFAEAIDLGRSLRDMSESEVSELLLFAQAAGAACAEEIGTTPGVSAKRVAKLLEEQGEIVRANSSIG